MLQWYNFSGFLNLDHKWWLAKKIVKIKTLWIMPDLHFKLVLHNWQFSFNQCCLMHILYQWHLNKYGQDIYMLLWTNTLDAYGQQYLTRLNNSILDLWDINLGFVCYNISRDEGEKGFMCFFTYVYILGPFFAFTLLYSLFVMTRWAK